MKVLFLGDFSAELDEGYKNISHYLSAALEAHATVQRADYKQITRPFFWRQLFGQPDIIHLVAQPTVQSLIFMALLRLFVPRAKRVLAALKIEQAALSQWRFWLRLAKVQLFLTQTETHRQILVALGQPAEILPNGVDLDAFRPAVAGEKDRLREKHNLDLKQTLVLSVGHLEPKRNLLSLAPLIEAGIQVAVVGSLYNGEHPHLMKALETAGIRVWAGYRPDVADFYRMADAYIFPVQPGDSLTMPLSVIEALACDLPVVTTAFAGLQRAFADCAGVQFLTESDDLLARVQSACAARVESRCCAEPFSWAAIAGQLASRYRELLDR
jgi:glycosyltransferase involved in cell wall biosynthesis